jgi:hypothetical protein
MDTHNEIKLLQNKIKRIKEQEQYEQEIQQAHERALDLAIEKAYYDEQPKQ